MDIKKILTRISHWILPYICVLCGSQSKRDIDLCLACEEDLPWIKSACYQCGLALKTAAEGNHCGICLSHRPFFDNTLALFSYQPPIDKFIVDLKFHHNLLYANVLGHLMKNKLMQHYANKTKPDCIIPVPLHKKRLRQRGFNQALELAKLISKALRIPLDINQCQRHKATLPQTLIPTKERKNNLLNAFSVANNFRFKHILIIDDVMTTANTVNELAKALKRVNVERIDVCCVARTHLQ